MQEKIQLAVPNGLDFQCASGGSSRRERKAESYVNDYKLKIYVYTTVYFSRADRVGDPPERYFGGFGFLALTRTVYTCYHPCMLHIQTPNLYEEAYEQIRHMLLYGEIAVGSRISSVELSKKLGISRTPIREAIRRLASEGLVKQVSGFGAFMQMPTPEELVELYDMREVLESFAAAEAAVRITDAELAELDGCCAQWRDMVLQLRRLTGQGLISRLYNRWITIDERFHEVLLTSSRNRLLRKAVSDMRLMSRTLDLRRLDSNSLPLITFYSAAWTYRHHASLVRALKRRDAELARTWMSRQIRTGKRLHLEHLKRVNLEMPDSLRKRLVEGDGSAEDA